VLTEGFTVQPGYWLFEDLFKGGTTADELRQEICALERHEARRRLAQSRGRYWGLNEHREALELEGSVAIDPKETWPLVGTPGKAEAFDVWAR
jgi:hypothetical protein